MSTFSVPVCRVASVENHENADRDDHDHNKERKREKILQQTLPGIRHGSIVRVLQMRASFLQAVLPFAHGTCHCGAWEPGEGIRKHAA